MFSCTQGLTVSTFSLQSPSCFCNLISLNCTLPPTAKAGSLSVELTFVLESPTAMPLGDGVVVLFWQAVMLQINKHNIILTFFIYTKKTLRFYRLIATVLVKSVLNTLWAASWRSSVWSMFLNTNLVVPTCMVSPSRKNTVFSLGKRSSCPLI